MKKLHILSTLLPGNQVHFNLFASITLLFATTLTAQTGQPIQWINLVRVEVSGTDNNTLTKSGSKRGAADATQKITGDGSISLLAEGTNARRAIGLSSTNPDKRLSSINYCLYLQSDSNLDVLENNVVRKSIKYSNGDRLSVERVGSTINYKRNGTTIYTSTIASSGALLVDVTLIDAGSVLADVRIYNASVEDDEDDDDDDDDETEQDGDRIFDGNVTIRDVDGSGNEANLEVFGESIFGPVVVDVAGGDLGTADNVDYQMAPFLLKHDTGSGPLCLAFDGDQLSTDAESFTIQNTNQNGGITFQTGATATDRLKIAADGKVTVSGNIQVNGAVMVVSPAGDIPSITY